MWKRVCITATSGARKRTSISGVSRVLERNGPVGPCRRRIRSRKPSRVLVQAPLTVTNWASSTSDSTMASGSCRPHASLNRNSISRIASSSALVMLAPHVRSIRPVAALVIAGRAQCASLIAPYASLSAASRIYPTCGVKPGNESLVRSAAGCGRSPVSTGSAIGSRRARLVGTGPAVDGDRGTVSLGSHRRRLLGDLTADIDRLGDEGGNKGEAGDACHNLELRHLSRSPMLG